MAPGCSWNHLTLCGHRTVPTAEKQLLCSVASVGHTDRPPPQHMWSWPLSQCPRQGGMTAACRSEEAESQRLDVLWPWMYNPWLHRPLCGGGQEHTSPVVAQDNKVLMHAEWLMVLEKFALPPALTPPSHYCSLRGFLFPHFTHTHTAKLSIICMIV